MGICSEDQEVLCLAFRLKQSCLIPFKESDLKLYLHLLLFRSAIRFFAAPATMLDRDTLRILHVLHCNKCPPVS